MSYDVISKIRDAEPIMPNNAVIFVTQIGTYQTHHTHDVYAPGVEYSSGLLKDRFDDQPNNNY